MMAKSRNGKLRGFFGLFRPIEGGGRKLLWISSFQVLKWAMGVSEEDAGIN